MECMREEFDGCALTIDDDYMRVISVVLDEAGVLLMEDDCLVDGLNGTLIKLFS